MSSLTTISKIFFCTYIPFSFPIFTFLSNFIYESKKIAIIGGGNLGSSIAQGLLESGFTKPQHIMVTKRNTDTLNALKQKGVSTGNNFPVVRAMPALSVVCQNKKRELSVEFATLVLSK